MATSSKRPRTQDSGYVDNWQAGKTVTECNLHMLTTEDCSDVIFRVGSEKQVVRAHRYVLVSRSSVFDAMFCGALAEKGEVTIPDIEADVFRDFLRYLYTDTVSITAENITGLLYTSRKYDADGLLAKCTSYLKWSLSENNVCEILEQCHGYGEMDLEQKALKILTEAGETVIKSKGFLDLCGPCLEKFLKSENLKLNEEDIFEATLLWAEEQCKRENESASPENLRKQLGDMIYEIRFASLSQGYLVNIVSPSGLLTSAERLLILDKTINAKIDITPFKTSLRRRSLLIPTSVSKVTRYDTITTDWGVVGGTEAVSFSVNRNIQLLGCLLYGPASQAEATYEVNILLYDDQNWEIAEPLPKGNKKLSGQNVRLNDLMFPNPVPILAGRSYTICVSMKGERTFYGSEGKRSVISDGVKFKFKNSPKSHQNLTTTKRGQIPGLIWSL